MHTISVYLNPRASNGQADYWQSQLNTALFRSQMIYRSPWDREELDKCLDEDIKNKVDAIVSVGGDGTVNTLIQKMAGKDIGLLIAPAGTANDLASEMGCLNDVRKAIQCLRQKKYQEIDLININGQYMATNGGLGFGGPVGERINYLRKKIPLFKNVMKFSGDKIYQFFIAQELIASKIELYDLEIQTDEHSLRVNSPGIFISNQSTLGGRFHVAPKTSNCDGLFNIMILKHRTKTSLIRFVTRVAMGADPSEDPDCLSFETSWANIKNHSQKKAQFFGDGEVFKSSQDFEVKVLKKSLKIFAQDKTTPKAALLH